MLLFLGLTHLRILLGLSGTQGFWRYRNKQRLWRERWQHFEAQAAAFAQSCAALPTLDPDTLMALGRSKDIPTPPLPTELRFDFFESTTSPLGSRRNRSDLIAYVVGNLLYTFSTWRLEGTSVTGRYGDGIVHISLLSTSPGIAVQLWTLVQVYSHGHMPSVTTTTGVLWWVERTLLADGVLDRGDLPRTRRNVLRSLLPPSSSLGRLAATPWGLLRRYLPRGGFAHAFLHFWSPSLGDIGDALAITDRRRTFSHPVVLRTPLLTDIDRHKKVVQRFVDAIVQDATKLRDAQSIPHPDS
jgi:hypothetical protein